MNKTLKWVLIGLGIAIVAFLVALPLFGMHRVGFSMMPRYSGFERGFPFMGVMPMMAFGFIRGLIGLGILVLAITGVVLLVRNGSAKKVEPPTPTEPAAIVDPVTNCHNCGREIKVAWVACPYCGKKQ